MTLTFQLRFRTEPGQSLFLTGNHDLLGNGQIEKALPLSYLNAEFWQGSLSFDPASAPSTPITYHYILRDKDGSVVHDWGADRIFNPALLKHSQVLVIDAWNDPGSVENAFYTEPFKEVLLRTNQTEVRLPAPASYTHVFRVKAPLLGKGQTLCLLGDAPQLGHWNTVSPILLARSHDEDFLSAHLDLHGAWFPIAYKYGVYDVERQTFVRYEDGENRILRDQVTPGKLTIINDGFAALPANTWRGAGVAVPVFSLRSEQSFGVGEFSDLKLLADWCARTGLKLIQILPINDTTATHSWQDSYPYSAISAFALHPLYLSLNELVESAGKPIAPSFAEATEGRPALSPSEVPMGRDFSLEENHSPPGSEPKQLLNSIEAERQRLNSLPDLDYQGVISVKLDFIRKVFPSLKDRTFQSEDYRQFFDQNKSWLVPYALFCYLRDKYGTADFNQWPEHRTCPKPAPDPADAEIALTYFTQYHLHAQLRHATDYCRSKGVVVKGDIPIGVYRHGADVWQQPELYNTDMQAGAPPDPFSDKGQNWQFPTYNWARMEQDGFAWWKQRFAQMSAYFDAFRIDHILGFFRIWSIPAHAVEGILGYFVQALPVHIGEFSSRGIWFDRNRYTRPQISDRLLHQLFGQETEAVKARFLERQPFGQNSLGPEFATQRQVEAYFANVGQPRKHSGLPRKPGAHYDPTTIPIGSPPPLPARDERGEGRGEGHQNPDADKRLIQGLFDLIANVILIEAPGSNGQQFHFRLGIESTSSFRDLDGQTQARLKDLYIDYFYRRQDDFWRKEGLRKLPALKRVTNMLVCGEDLGMVPASVPGVMKQLGLLSLEVQRMPKALNQQFSRPKDAPYLSVVTPGTHDMSTIRGWWEEDRGVTQRFYNQELGRPGEAPRQCDPWIVEAVIGQHLASPAIWSIFQLQDLLGMDGALRHPHTDEERINIPANPKHYWRYRMHLTIEKLMLADQFNRKLKTMIEQAGRIPS